MNSTRTRLFIAFLGISACSAAETGPSIAFQHITTLGADGDSGSFPGMPIVSGPYGGRYFATTPWARGDAPITEFDTDGNFRRYLGDFGDGPGDLKAPLWIFAGPADSLFVVDLGHRRVHTFDKFFSYAHSILLEKTPLWSARLDTGHLLFTVSTYGERDPLVLQRANGTLVSRWRSDSSQRHSGSAPDLHVVATGSNSSFWVAPLRRRYRLSEWDTGGRFLRQVVPRSDWFESYERYQAPTPEKPPSPELRGLWINNGHAWVLGLVADASWAEGLGPATTGEGGIRYFPILDEAATYDAVIEIYELASGDLVASARMDTPFTYLTPTGHFVRITETDDGWRRAEMWLADVEE